MTEKKNDQYLFDKFIENSDKTLQEKHLENFTEFTKTYRENLKTIYQKITNTEEDFSTVWDSSQDPIKFNFTFEEESSFEELLTTDHTLMKKIILILSHICQELIYLKKIVIFFYILIHRLQINFIQF